MHSNETDMGFVSKIQKNNYGFTIYYTLPCISEKIISILNRQLIFLRKENKLQHRVSNFHTEIYIWLLELSDVKKTKEIFSNCNFY